MSALFNSGDTLWCLLFRLGTGVKGARASGELIGHLRIGQELRFPQDDGGFSAGRGRCGNRVNVPLGHANELGERLGRVRARGGRPIEYRAHPVQGADSTQAAQQIGDMCAEHATVAVYFVKHHIAQPAQEVRPLPVVA